MTAVPHLTDGVVTLRAPQESDVPGSVEQVADSLTRAWTEVPRDYTTEHARWFLLEHVPDGWEQDREWCFAVEALDHADGGRPRFAGTVSLVPQRGARAEVSYAAHPWARGRGILERALRLLLTWGFEEQDLASVLWLSRRGNWPSRRLAWKVGFSCDGVLERWLPTGPQGPLADTWVGTLPRGTALAPRTPWPVVPRITGERVVLRRTRDDDADRVLEACTDERTAYWLGQLPQPYTPELARQFVSRREEDVADGRAVHWVLADPTTDALLGVVSLMWRGPGLDCEVGYWAHPDARGRGAMTEAVRLAVRHAVVPVEDGGLGLPRLTAYAAVDNRASRHVLEVNGFAPSGVERGAADVRDGRHDLAGYDLLATEVRTR
ncbi:MAG: Protein N-acetyltransferase, RimJ/RimL family [Marmoricola sp.]|nr:Protein N-acetyltransferase, RimJ/RimL family [Marmoricola sp.]